MTITKRLTKQIVLSLTALLLTLSLSLFRVSSEKVPFYWEYTNVNIDVQSKGDLLVTDEIRDATFEEKEKIDKGVSP